MGVVCQLVPLFALVSYLVRRLTFTVPHPRLKSPPFRNFKFPAVLIGNALGDQLVALPALRALAHIFPSRLALICMPGFRRKFFAELRLRSVCEVPMHIRTGRRRFDAAAVAKRVGKCDLFVSLNPWTSESLHRLVQLLSPELSVGLRSPCQIGRIAKWKKHAFDLGFTVPSNLKPSLRLDAYVSPPRIPAQVSPRIREYLRAAAPRKKILAIHNESKPQKVWPAERLRTLVEEFLDRHPDFAVFILDLELRDLKIGKHASRLLHSRGLPLHYAFAVLRESELFLGVDSCMLHAADLCRVPGVGLFGKTDPRRWGFRFSRHRHIRDRRGLKHISEIKVLQALESLIPAAGR